MQRQAVMICSMMQVIRCFEDDNVIHVSGRVDPVDDSDVINLELALADIAQIERRMERLNKKAKSKEEATQQEVCHFSMKVIVSLSSCIQLPSWHVSGCLGLLIV